MQVDDIRVFIPSKDYGLSQSFYQALGFKMEYVSDDLSLFENGASCFFLHRSPDTAGGSNLMLQLAVQSIDDAFKTISDMERFSIIYEPVKVVSWGKVIYLWGPSGELWHITEFNHTNK